MVKFRISVTNTGKSVLTVLPMTDTFNALFLQYVTASALPDFNLNGILRWNDLTTAASVGDLLPNTSKSITVTFLALRDTYLAPGSVTTNTVTIQNGLADPDGTGTLAGNLEPLTQATSAADVEIDGPTSVLLRKTALCSPWATRSPSTGQLRARATFLASMSIGGTAKEPGWS